MSAFILLLPFMLALISHSPTPDSSSKLLITEFSILNSPTPLFITADPITSKFSLLLDLGICISSGLTGIFINFSLNSKYIFIILNYSLHLASS